MSEQKICPYRKQAHYPNSYTNPMVVEWVDEFAPCLEDKCAMWRVDFPNGKAIMDEKQEHILGWGPPEGHCGLAGRP